MVVRDRPRRRGARTPSGRCRAGPAQPLRPTAVPRSQPPAPRRPGSTIRTGRSTGSRPSRRSWSWPSARLSTPLRRALPPRGPDPMRFQDAAKDARAVVYAGIQADPLVGRLATLAADATYPQRLMARAVMNGESTDPAAWRRDLPDRAGPRRAGARPRRGDPRGQPGGRRPRRAGALAVPRRVRRGADPGSSCGVVSGRRPGPRSGASVGCSSTASLPRSTRTT